MESLFLLNLSASLFLCGLIWVIQLLHYPFFHHIEKSDFIKHQSTHKFRISILVIPAMLTELGSSAILAYGANFEQHLHISGFIIVLLIWASSFFIQVPLHHKISGGYDTGAVDRLVSTNWIRTILWTTKALISIWIAYRIWL